MHVMLDNLHLVCLVHFKGVSLSLGRGFVRKFQLVGCLCLEIYKIITFQHMISNKMMLYLYMISSRMYNKIFGQVDCTRVITSQSNVIKEDTKVLQLLFHPKDLSTTTIGNNINMANDIYYQYSSYQLYNLHNLNMAN